MSKANKLEIKFDTSNLIDRLNDLKRFSEDDKYKNYHEEIKRKANIINDSGNFLSVGSNNIFSHKIEFSDELVSLLDEVDRIML